MEVALRHGFRHGLRHGVRHIIAARDEARPHACATADRDGQPYLGGRDAADRDGQPYLGGRETRPTGDGQPYREDGD